jgi:group I intron endonuclease
MNYSIYIITNTVNGKQYIGYTKDPFTRFKNHCFYGKRGTGSCKRLYQSMYKYGVDKFQFDILETNIGDIETAKLLEIKYIKEYDTCNSGYNSTLGGTGGDMSKYESWQNAINLVHKNRPSYVYASYGMKDKNHSEETKAKQSEKRLEYWESLTNEERIIRSSLIKGENNGMFGKLPKNAISIEFNGKIYNSLSEAVNDTGHSSKFLKKHGKIL